MSKVALVLPSNIEYDLYTYLYFLREAINEYQEIDFILPCSNSKKLFSQFLSTIPNRSLLIDNNAYNYTWSNESLHSPLNVYYYLRGKNYKTIIGFDTFAETYFCIYSKSIGFSYTDVSFKIISVQPAWFPIINQGKMLSSVDSVILAGMEEFVVMNADMLEGNRRIIEAIYNLSNEHKHCKAITHSGTYQVKPKGNVALYWGPTIHSLGLLDFIKAVSLIPCHKEIEIKLVSTDNADTNEIIMLLESHGLKQSLGLITKENDLIKHADLFNNILFCYLPSIINYYGLIGIAGEPEFPVIVSKPLFLRGVAIGEDHMDYPAPTLIYKHVEKITTLGIHDNLELSHEFTIEELSPECRRVVDKRGGVTNGEKILVSVCLVHFNRPVLLRYALDSILEQDYPYIEIIISDDGSAPVAVSEVKKYLNKEPYLNSEISIKYIEHSNRYLGAARNRAIKHAKGQYILFMDDDNYAMKHEISTLVKIARKNKDAFFVGSFMAVFNSNNIDNVSWNGLDIFAGIGCTNLAGMIQNNYSDANGLYNIEKLLKLGCFSEDYGIGYEDWELFYKAKMHNMQILTVPEPLFYYRVNEGDSMARDHTSASINLNRVARVLFQNRNNIINNNESFYNMLLLQGLIFSKNKM